ncbi:hypothetical protein BDY21DRAFT_214157 [Lineolata rhizophorae]|uniref:Uncharacterized protein n=1 Tax=Lineolata rhizophorae TaxID=578093 RepID=A0A6A6P3W5_9PEZI|nr:hypothetical protein BDY21DRAFT_214157 [Lineolata rhizophorae]
MCKEVHGNMAFPTRQEALPPRQRGCQAQVGLLKVCWHTTLGWNDSKKICLESRKLAEKGDSNNPSQVIHFPLCHHPDHKDENNVDGKLWENAPKVYVDQEAKKSHIFLEFGLVRVAPNDTVDRQKFRDAQSAYKGRKICPHEKLSDLNLFRQYREVAPAGLRESVFAPCRFCDTRYCVRRCRVTDDPQDNHRVSLVVGRGNVVDWRNLKESWDKITR